MTINCSEQYQSGDYVICVFSITNNHPVNYLVLEWYTPLEGMRSDFVSVISNGSRIPYDGVLIKRSATPDFEDYKLVSAGNTVSGGIDLSQAYSINLTMQYYIKLHFQLLYHTETNDTVSIQTLESGMVSFQLVENEIPKVTFGEQCRNASLAEIVKDKVQQNYSPRDPRFVGGTPDQQALTKEIHRASYHYVSAAEDDIEDNEPHYVLWFGAVDGRRIQQVQQNFHAIRDSLRNTIFTYHFGGPECRPRVIAYTTFHSSDIYLCDLYNEREDILGVDTKLGVLIHEFSHAVALTDDVEYGRKYCLDLATNHPNDAINNAANYCYFAETMNIFDYGFDSVSMLPNGHTYVTRGNVYIGYSDSSASKVDNGYPHLIKGRWGDLPDTFLFGFDSITTLPNGKIYVTKDDQYVRYSDTSADTLDSGYPSKLQGSWGVLPAGFGEGFDAVGVLPNGKTYVTKANQYIRYSDRWASTVDDGYPAQLQNNWGNLPASFADGFDSIALLGNGKIYITKGKEYIRYSDNSGSTIDSGYPLPIKGNWGTINFP